MDIYFSLNSIDLSSFNSTNVNNMNSMLYEFSSLQEENIKIRNKIDRLSKELHII